jgi:hypothetical protein
MSEHRITQIPFLGSSGRTPTGAIQFQDDWPGLFVRGDDAIMLMSAIEQLRDRLANHPDVVLASALNRLSRYADIIARDVIVRWEQLAEWPVRRQIQWIIMAKQPYNPVLRAAILEVVDNQLRDGTPPETRATLNRLMADGIPESEARELIACVVSTEIFDILKSGQPYLEERYVACLRALPRLPWENEK